MEKVLDGNRKAVAQLLQRGNRHAAVASADNVIDRRLCDPAERTQPVDGKMPLLAQLQNTFPHSLPNIHTRSLISMFEDTIHQFQDIYHKINN